MDDAEPSGTTEDKKTTVIQQQTNVIQNGENNFNLTNNGTMNFDIKGGDVLSNDLSVKEKPSSRCSLHAANGDK